MGLDAKPLGQQYGGKLGLFRLCLAAYAERATASFERTLIPPSAETVEAVFGRVAVPSCLVATARTGEVASDPYLTSDGSVADEVIAGRRAERAKELDEADRSVMPSTPSLLDRKAHARRNSLPRTPIRGRRTPLLPTEELVKDRRPRYGRLACNRLAGIVLVSAVTAWAV